MSRVNVVWKLLGSEFEFSDLLLFYQVSKQRPVHYQALKFVVCNLANMAGKKQHY